MFFNKRNADDDKTLQDVIDNHLNYMSELDNDSPAFDEAVAKLERLYKLKNSERSSRVSPDTWVTASVSLATVLLIINHERLNVISTKALGFVRKP